MLLPTRTACRSVAALVVAAVALGAMAGCRHDDPRYFGSTKRVADDETFYLNNADEPEFLDPGLVSDTASTPLVQELFEGLFVGHPQDLHPVQGMAERYERNADATLFRFHLREARWSDGRAVTAGDFVYAWQRVLTPATAARQATLLYVLANGKLFHQGKLRRLRRPESLRATGGQAVELAEGTFVRIHGKSPAKWQGAIDLAETADPKAALGVDARPAEASRRVRLLRLGPSLRCNGAADQWFEVAAEGGATGWLPGCALADDEAATDALVTRAQLPTFAPRPEDGAPKEAGPSGFVPLAELVEDPSSLGVRAVDDRTLEVELAEPTPYFVDLCTLPTLFPVRRDAVERFGDIWYRPEHIVSNGPFRLASWRFRYELTLTANPDHHDHERMRLRRLVFMAVPDQLATMNLYKTGEIDWVGSNVSLPTAYMHLLEQKADFSRSMWLGTYWYEFNVTVPPVDDVRVRRALYLAVERQLIIDKVARGGQLPATHFVPDATGGGYAAAAAADARAGRDAFARDDLGFDPERARALLAEAGYPVVADGDGYRAEGFPSLEILYNTNDGHQKIALAIQDMWKRHLGISARLHNEEWNVYMRDLRDGHFQVARFGWVADYNHPLTFLDTFLSYSSNNWTRWKNGAFDALVEKAGATVDPVQAGHVYRQAEQVALEDMARLPIYFYTKSTLVKPWVRGFYPNAMNVHPLRYVWIDRSWQGGGPSLPAFAPDELAPPGSYAP